MRTLCLIAVLVCCPGTLVVAQSPSHDPSQGIDPDRYVTRFKNTTKLVYEPRVEYVEKTVSKGSWIPFLRSGKFERKKVPVVSWAPKWTSEQQPVTDRITMRSSGPTPQLARNEPESHRKTHRSARPENERTDGWIAVGRLPTPNLIARPTENANENDMSKYGGIQRIDGIPRTGMRTQARRY